VKFREEFFPTKSSQKNERISKDFFLQFSSQIRPFFRTLKFLKNFRVRFSDENERKISLLKNISFFTWPGNEDWPFEGVLREYTLQHY